MAFNYMRGKQMIIHDPRLDGQVPGGPPPNPPAKPPAAFNVWTVNKDVDTAAHIIGWAATVATGNKRLDALHFMVHGLSAWVQLGIDDLSWGNIGLFQQLSPNVRFIVFWACEVGTDTTSSSLISQNFGSRVAKLSGANVVTARQKQNYSLGPDGTIDFGPWEGDVIVFNPPPNPGYSESPGPGFNLEKLIFGS
jgi:hypothetical protein